MLCTQPLAGTADAEPLPDDEPPPDDVPGPDPDGLLDARDGAEDDPVAELCGAAGPRDVAVLPVLSGVLAESPELLLQPATTSGTVTPRASAWRRR
ncbi:hypothetical protein [Flexivirga meconopsidis]|uniref:hypothetical protein n=1 Tax=Flexivirga meconopsidis TaxID=2977121 RepID=UPI00223FD735|nr:hypothetical protein [Flexivirga meconopsidis]